MTINSLVNSNSATIRHVDQNMSMPFITRKQKIACMKMLTVLANLEDQKSKRGFIRKQNVLFVDKSAVLKQKTSKVDGCIKLFELSTLKADSELYTKIWEDTWAMPQSQSTAFPRLQKKKR